MPLHSFLGMEIGVPDPTALSGFYAGIGLLPAPNDSGRWGTEDQPDQIEIVEAPYRQLKTMRIGCHDESDLDATAKRPRWTGRRFDPLPGEAARRASRARLDDLDRTHNVDLFEAEAAPRLECSGRTLAPGAPRRECPRPFATPAPTTGPCRRGIAGPHRRREVLQ